MKKGSDLFVMRGPDSPEQVIAFAKGCAPVMRPAVAGAKKPMADIVLKTGSTFRLKMTDARGRPAAGVNVKLVTWQGSRAMSWATKTDSEGRFRWDHAPEGRLIFEYEKAGYSRYTHSLMLPMTREATYTYSSRSGSLAA